MRVVDSRRLTGPNIHDRGPGAVAELRFAAGFDPAPWIEAWKLALARGLRRLEWTGARLHVRRFRDLQGRQGAELMFTAPVDRLYAATDLNEWAIAEATRHFSPHAHEADASAPSLESIAAAAGEEQEERAGLLALLERAEALGVPALVDDDQLSLGYYDQSVHWPLRGAALPAPEDVDWSRFSPRPVVVITGTNGKTTTTRMLARMARRAGFHVGNTSTDGLYVDERLSEAGDWTGPGGARAVLRNDAIDLALLEAARGGLLRRGLGVRRCDVAVITNVEEDHLGEFGVFDLAAMAAAKGIVAMAAAPSGRIVLGADSPALVEWAQARRPSPGPVTGDDPEPDEGPAQLPAQVVWFSLDPGNPVLLRHHDSGGEVWTVEDGWMVRRREGGSRKLAPVEDMPASFGGRARHNIANALAAAAAAWALGMDERAIVSALLEFGSRPEDNPGRARLWSVSRPGGGSVTVLLDFAHNLAGFAAIRSLVLGLAEEHGRAPVLSLGMAGDRSDDELRALGAALVHFAPRVVVLREQSDYLRGRGRGEVPPLLAEGLVAAGFDSTQIDRAQDEVDSLSVAMSHCEDGDLIVLLVHTEYETVDAWLAAHGARMP
ncbi:MAG: hypothetical protein KC457_00625 [Myxococcales bacterium]|nr:hypothetical protein [Myxococcales bacterium]